MSLPLLFVLLGFISGSVPWSLILGFAFLQADIRTVGDGNPGAFNVIRAGGGSGLVAAAMFLDALKAGLPVGLAVIFFGIDGWLIVPVALAPLLGHMFSPFLGYKGGKGVASTIGLWAGLTLFWEAPFVLGAFLGLFFFGVTNSGFAVLLMMCGWLGHIVVTGRTEPTWLVLWGLNTALLAYKYRADLQEPVAFREAYKRRVDSIFRREGVEN